MNSVMEIGDHIVYMHQGVKAWEGNSKDIIFSENEQLNEYIFASAFLRDARNMRNIKETGEVPDEVKEEIKDALEDSLNLNMDGDGKIGKDDDENQRTSA